MTNRIETRSYVLPQTLLGRVAACILAAIALVAAFFSFFVILLTAGVLIAGLWLRLLWQRRQLRKQAAADALEGEYIVEPREQDPAIPQRE